MTRVIDAHQHFWSPGDGHYPWMAGDEMAPIRHEFWPEELRPELQANQVDATVLVQTWSSMDETRNYLTIAGQTDFVAGVVGWVDLTDPALNQVLSALKNEPHGEFLVGVRHQVHDEADAEWLLRDDVQRGLKIVADAGLVYDLLTRPRELPAALATVKRQPHCRFVIDHISKPDIANQEIDQWRALIQPFGIHANVFCKVSGMVTEANWQEWTSADLEPYVDVVLDTFGAGRLLFGSDWPVSLLAARYKEVKIALEDNIASLSVAERAAIMGGNAEKVYGLG